MQKYGIRKSKNVKVEENAEFTLCPRSLDPFYSVSYFIKRVKTSWTYSTVHSELYNIYIYIYKYIYICMCR